MEIEAEMVIQELRSMLDRANYELAVAAALLKMKDAAIADLERREA